MFLCTNNPSVRCAMDTMMRWRDTSIDTNMNITVARTRKNKTRHKGNMDLINRNKEMAVQIYESPSVSVDEPVSLAWSISSTI